MELNREQIIKVLECCIEGTSEACLKCVFGLTPPYPVCKTMVQKQALALINSYEEQIFALENRLKECENGYEGTLHLESCKLHDAEQKVKELTEENKAWQKQLISQEEKSGKSYYDLACEVEDLRAENERLRKALSTDISIVRVSRGSGKTAHLREVGRIKVDAIRADTVQKMQKRLGEHFVEHNEVKYGGGLVHKVLDKVAKEMLKGETP